MAETSILELRNAIYDRLASGVSSYTYETTRKTPLPTLQAEQLPALSVYILEGDGRPDGEGNTGVVRLIEEDTIAVSIVRGLADTVALEGNMDAEYEAIRDKLFTDPTFVRFGDGMFFESLERTRRRWLFPQHGDEYRIELQYAMTFRRRSVFEPVIVDDYHKTILTTRPAGKDDKAPAITTVFDQAQD